MALWGDLDNINVNSSGLYGPPTGTASTIMFDYGTGICTGAAGISSWGRTGFAATGDTIRFGIKDESGVYYGDANIISIANSESLDNWFYYWIEWSRCIWGCHSVQYISGS